MVLQVGVGPGGRGEDPTVGAGAGAPPGGAADAASGALGEDPA